MREARLTQLLWNSLACSQSGEYSALPWALQERWRVAAEKSKAESAQRTLEEQRKIMVQQIAMEREELERAKVSPEPHSAVSPPFLLRTLTPPASPSYRAPC